MLFFSDHIFIQIELQILESQAIIKPFNDHLKFDVEPDMAMFGKTMGNGYGITAVVGKKEIMESSRVASAIEKN